MLKIESFYFSKNEKIQKEMGSIYFLKYQLIFFSLQDNQNLISLTERIVFIF